MIVVHGVALEAVILMPLGRVLLSYFVLLDDYCILLLLSLTIVKRIYTIHRCTTDSDVVLPSTRSLLSSWLLLLNELVAGGR